MPEFFDPKVLFNSLVYSILGVVVFWISFVIIDKLTPYALWKEIVENKNMSLAIVVGAMSLGIAIIIAAAIHG
jgi:putative membrane protein